eukprot:5898944-Pleurochrysis_carterae.AAC.4
MLSASLRRLACSCASLALPQYTFFPCINPNNTDTQTDKLYSQPEKHRRIGKARRTLSSASRIEFKSGWVRLTKGLRSSRATWHAPTAPVHNDVGARTRSHTSKHCTHARHDDIGAADCAEVAARRAARTPHQDLQLNLYLGYRQMLDICAGILSDTVRYQQ